MTGFLSHEEVEALAAHALDAALRGGASGADVLYSEGCANGLTLKDGEIEESTSGSSAGLGVRTILADGRQGIAYGNRLDRSSVDSLIEWSLHNARASQPEEGVMLYDGPLVRCPELEAEDERIHEITPKQRMEYCAQMTEVAKSTDARIISVRSAAWRDGWGASFFATTKGLSGWEQGSSANCGVVVLAQSGEFTEMGGYGMDALRLCELDAAKCARTAVKQTVAALGGTQLETGTYTIVIDPDAAVPLVDAIGGLFCASDVHRGRSLMKGRIGDLVASPCVNLTDDGRVAVEGGQLLVGLRGRADLAHGAHKGRHRLGLPLQPPVRREGRREVHRQLLARHVLAARRGDGRTSSSSPGRRARSRCSRASAAACTSRSSWGCTR